MNVSCVGAFRLLCILIVAEKITKKIFLSWACLWILVFSFILGCQSQEKNDIIPKKINKTQKDSLQEEYSRLFLEYKRLDKLYSKSKSRKERKFYANKCSEVSERLCILHKKAFEQNTLKFQEIK